MQSALGPSDGRLLHSFIFAWGQVLMEAGGQVAARMLREFETVTCLYRQEKDGRASVVYSAPLYSRGWGRAIWEVQKDQNGTERNRMVLNGRRRLVALLRTFLSPFLPSFLPSVCPSKGGLFFGFFCWH